MEITSFNTKGIEVCLCGSKKFAAVSVCLVLRAPLRRETVSSYALIPRVLSRASKMYPSLRAVNSRLEEMGGAQLTAEPIKKGEEQIISFYASAPKRFASELFEFLSGIVYDPFTAEDGFMPSYVRNACSAAARDIADKINNKRDYAAEKMIELMCSSEYFGICGDGYTEDFGDISGKGLYKAYTELIKSSAVQLYITGDISRSEAEKYINDSFDGSEPVTLPKAEQEAQRPHRPVLHTEEAKSAQSALALGIRTHGAAHPKLLVANEILGGYASSRLFAKVREEAGMCYYISSQLYRYKGIISVQAGIEAKNTEAVVERTRRELDSINKKGASQKELRLAKDSLITALKTIEDYPARLTDFLLSRSIAGESLSVDDALSEIEAVDNVSGVFDNAFIDTVFLLKEGTV